MRSLKKRYIACFMSLTLLFSAPGALPVPAAETQGQTEGQNADTTNPDGDPESSLTPEEGSGESSGDIFEDPGEEDCVYTYTYLGDGRHEATCQDCGDSFTEDCTEAAPVNEKEATELEDGYSGDVYCSLCGGFLKEGEILPATGIPMGECKITFSKKSYAYTGKAIRPVPTVTFQGKRVDPANYSLSYKNNVKTGTASLILTGKGICHGNATATFVIADAIVANSNALLKGERLLFKNNKLVFTWGKVATASGYDIFAGTYGRSSASAKPTKTIKSKNKLSLTIKKIGKKALSAKKEYMVNVEAYRIVGGKKRYIGLGKVLVVSGGKTKKSNATSITLKKSTVTLKKGKSYQIKATAKKAKKAKKLANHFGHRGLRYYSMNQAVARVSQSGKITARAKGSTKIYVLADNGLKKAVKVTVR